MQLSKQGEFLKHIDTELLLGAPGAGKTVASSGNIEARLIASFPSCLPYAIQLSGRRQQNLRSIRSSLHIHQWVAEQANRTSTTTATHGRLVVEKGRGHGDGQGQVSGPLHGPEGRVGPGSRKASSYLLKILDIVLLLLFLVALLMLLSLAKREAVQLG